MDYTALGSPVNLAARLESKAPSNEVIISDATLNLVKSQIKYEYFDEITPKGFARPVQIHKLIDFISKDKKLIKKVYSRKGKHVDINVFDTSDIKEAIKELKQIQIEFSKDIEKEER